MAEHSPGPFMKMSPAGFPGLVIVVFVVFTSCLFFGVEFLWVLFGLGILGVCFAAMLHFVHLWKSRDVELSVTPHSARRK